MASAASELLAPPNGRAGEVIKSTVADCHKGQVLSQQQGLWQQQHAWKYTKYHTTVHR